MIKCNCGREFKNIQAFSAHKFYCDDYVNSLSESERTVIEARRQHGKEVRKVRSDANRLAWVENFIKEGKTCPECGKLLPIPNQNHYMTYCSRSCACKAKSKNMSPETRERSNKLIGDAIRQAGVQRRKQKAEQYLQEHHVCEYCGSWMKFKYASGRFCSYECSQNYCNTWAKNHPEEFAERTKKIWSDPVHYENLIAGQKKAIAEGRWPPMMRSDRPSVPEIVWNQVLQNAGIRFSYNHLVKHSELGMNVPKLVWYKLDFYLIDYHVDLEIDGSEHNTPEHIESDRIRDINLTNGGYRVYRIPWIDKSSVPYQLSLLENYLDSLCRVNSSVEPKSIEPKYLDI